MKADSKSPDNITSLPQDKCFGCGVCVNVCPVNCIQMVEDHEGFLYPIVDEETCTACHQCIASCPGFNNSELPHRLDTPHFYGGQILDEPIRFSSSSGGIFSLLAKQVLSQNGAVYGAVIDYQVMRVTHARCTSEEALSPMRKSKYVQSDTTHIFPEVERDLSIGKPVLFVGTPCQLDGLLLYLGKTYNNLLTCDIVCHGVPSPALFSSHFLSLQEKYGTPISNIDFRTKDKGWGSFLNFYLKVETGSESHLTYAPLDAFYAMFLANLSLRPVCYQCPYTNLTRSGDLTIGDFWGVQKQSPELFDGKGTSLILANSQKGRAIIEKYDPSARLQKLQTLNPLPPNLVRPSPKPRYRDRIFTRISFDHWRQEKWQHHLAALGMIIKNKSLTALKKFLRIS